MREVCTFTCGLFCHKINSDGLAFVQPNGNVTKEWISFAQSVPYTYTYTKRTKESNELSYKLITWRLHLSSLHSSIHVCVKSIYTSLHSQLFRKNLNTLFNKCQ